MGKLLVIAGLIIAGVGVLVMMGLPIGRLPGDFTIKRGNATFYFPLATSILASIVLTLLLSMLRRYFCLTAVLVRDGKDIKKRMGRIEVGKRE